MPLTSEETTRELVTNIIRSHESENDSYLSKALAILSYRPFNMKGQEIEEIVGLVLLEGLQKYYQIHEPTVIVPQNKKTADILFQIGTTLKELDIKSYGGAERLQLSTLKLILPDIREHFSNHPPMSLNQEDKLWLIKKINSISTGYTLSFLSFNRKNNDVDVHCFEFETLNIQRFGSLQFELKRTAKEKRIEIFIPITLNSTLEISAGGNPYNRGMWINTIRNEEDMSLIYNTGFINKIFQKKILHLEFDKNKYALEKARATINLLTKYF